MSIQLYAPVAVLPYDIAVLYAAEQNFTSDVRRKIVTGEDRWEYLKASYIEEAMELLEDDYQNYHPEFDDMPLIRVTITGRAYAKTIRSCNLAGLMDYYYSHRHIANLVKPDPIKVISNSDVEKHLGFLMSQVRCKLAH